MKSSQILVATFLSLSIAAAPVGAAVAQGAQDGMAQMGPGTSQGGMRPGMTQGGMGQMGPGMMQGCKGRGMMQGMMQGGMAPGAAPLFGARVTPVMHLSVEDVRGYLDLQVERLNNKRLKVGDVKVDGGAIIADIVTVDNSLVQRLKVDPRTGAIEYEK